ncbi:MAG TPA: hypothetical protein VNO55_04535, partial [Polyangia bacterium]|nr:hypothetical protein [Polyangia bacterium]
GTVPPPAPPPSLIPPPTPSPPPGSLGGGPPVVPVEPAPHSGSRVARIVVGSILMGAGAVAGGLAIWQGKVAQEKADKLSSQSQQKGTILFNPAIEDNGKNANRFAILLGSVSGACLIAGGIVLLTAPSSSASSTEAPPRVPVASLAPVIGLGFMGAEAAWSF